MCAYNISFLTASLNLQFCNFHALHSYLPYWQFLQGPFFGSGNVGLNPNGTGIFLGQS